MSNKMVLNYCPNFHKIVNFDIDQDDQISRKLINIYQDYIFDIDLANVEETKLVNQIDNALSRYIDDYEFRKNLKESILKVKIKKGCTNILKAIVESIVSIFNNYEEYTTRNVYIARWI
ncbi:MAG: hypothetical protein J5634_02655 [Bacilli bacterium]|nr:hypothetical protein [Bacilli bacterium]